MALPVVPYTASMQAILEKNSHVLGELSSHPLATSYITQFDTFQTTWISANTARTLLVIAASKAQGAVEGADDALDDFVDTLDRTLLIAVKNDRSAQLYQAYFGTLAPSLLKRPVLQGELLTCRAWIPSLLASTLPAVTALAPVLTAVVAAADAAVAQKVAADQALKDFDMIGGKKTLIDSFNALCKTVYGELSALPHQNPTAMLPSNFADRFFPHDTRGGVTALTNPKDVQAVIDGLDADKLAAQAHLTDLENKAAAKAAKKKARDDAEAALATAKKEEAAAKQKVKDAEKAAKDAAKNPPPPATPTTPTTPTTPGG